MKFKIKTKDPYIDGWLLYLFGRVCPDDDSMAEGFDYAGSTLPVKLTSGIIKRYEKEGRLTITEGKDEQQ